MLSKPIHNHADYLYQFLKQQGLVYDDMCHELTDHIMCTLQDDVTVNADNFTEKLQQFVHSARMVHLVTAAKKQEQIRAKGYRDCILDRFFSAKGLVQLVVISVLIYLCFLNKISQFIVELGYVIAMLGMMWITGFKGIRKFPFYNKLIIQLGPLLITPVAAKYITDHYLSEYSGAGAVLTSICLSVMYIMLYYMYRANRNYNRKYYA